MPAAIKAIGLQKYYGTARGIENVDLEVDAGDIMGFIGPNGAGKSTTIRILLGLLKQSAGSATVLGASSWRISPRVLQRVGYLPASVSYYDRMKVDALLRLTSRFYDVDCGARIEKLCTELGVDTRRRFGELSTGNRKKVGIVQCFMHKPDVIILDEPTSGLDPLVQSRFFEILKDEHAQGTTVLLSSHTLSEVQNHCRRVAIIRDGRIVETSDVADLRRRRYRKVRIVADEQLIDEVLETDGVVLDSRGENRAVFLYEGVIAGLLARLSPSRIHDLLIEEPSLEEVFLHYYREDGEG